MNKAQLDKTLGTIKNYVDSTTKPKRILEESGTYGKTGFIAMAKMVITDAYVNRPIEFKFIQRGRQTPCTVSIEFLNINSTDPGLASLKYMGADFGVFMYKTAASTWLLYVTKSEAYDAVTLIENNTAPQNVIITYPGTFIETKPTNTTGNPVVNATLGYTVGTAATCSGNAATATKLKTAKNINGTSFDGSANITTANWGTARTITIGGTGKSVNGSGNVTWTLAEIGAAASSHTHNYAGSSSAGGAATSANKVNTNLVIKLNGGSTEGTNLFTFNGSAAKTVNITPASIGASKTNLSAGCYIQVTVNGDANKYYPVLIKSNGGGIGYPYLHINISRTYNATAPSTWNTSTHKGGLTLSIRWSGDVGWGGNDHTIKVDEFSESYTTMVAGLNLCTDGLLVWLRGGGALYQINSEYGTGLTATVNLSGYKDAGGTTYANRTDTSKVASEIMTKYVDRSTSGVFDNNVRVYSSKNKPTPADIGAAAASHGTHVSYGGNGSATTVSRSDHTHNYAGSSSAGGAANSSNVLNSNSRMDYGWNGLNYFNISGKAGNAAKANDTPTTAWWHIIRCNHANASGFYTDIAVPFNAQSMYYKRITSGAVQDGGWVKLLDAKNFGNYAAAKSHTHNYAGSGSAGGSANSAVKLATARKLTIGATGKTFDGSGNVSWSTSEILRQGSVTTGSWNDANALGVYEVSEWSGTNGPTGAYQWGGLLTLRTGNVQNQVYLSHSQNQMWIRGGWGGKWNTSWARVYTTDYKPSPADIGAAAASHGTHVSYGGNGSATTVSRSDHTHSYLPLAGGTLTGPVTVSGESRFHNGTYKDPLSGTSCAIKTTGHVAVGGNVYSTKTISRMQIPTSKPSSPSNGEIWIE